MASNKVLKTPLRLTITSLLIGMLLRILNWPYGFEIMFVSFCTLVLMYAYRFYKKEPKKTVDYIKMLLVIGWSTNGLLNLLDYPDTLLFQLLTGVTFVVWFVMEGTAYFMQEDRRINNTLGTILWNIALVVGALAIIAGSLLNVLEWRFAVPLLSVGISIIAAYIAKDIFNTETPQNNDQNNGELQL